MAASRGTRPATGEDAREHAWSRGDALGELRELDDVEAETDDAHKPSLSRTCFGQAATAPSFSLEVLEQGYGMRRLVRRGIPIHTPTYEVEGRLIWGATARILAELFDRLG